MRTGTRVTVACAMRMASCSDIPLNQKRWVPAVAGMTDADGNARYRSVRHAHDAPLWDSVEPEALGPGFRRDDGYGRKRALP
jgi:hypothetical protein